MKLVSFISDLILLPTILISLSFLCIHFIRLTNFSIKKQNHFEVKGSYNSSGLCSSFVDQI